MFILYPSKETEWKKWIGIYDQKLLSRGDLRDLYTYGYDVPEADAVEKDGKMYYAFFAPAATPECGMESSNCAGSRRVNIGCSTTRTTAI